MAGTSGAQPSSSAETLTGLLGSSDGQPLRRVARDANMVAITRTLTSSKGRVIRREGARALATALRSRDESMDEELDLSMLPPAARVKVRLKRPSPSQPAIPEMQAWMVLGVLAVASHRLPLARVMLVSICWRGASCHSRTIQATGWSL